MKASEANFLSLINGPKQFVIPNLPENLQLAI